jgi:hypothetical protein
VPSLIVATEKGRRKGIYQLKGNILTICYDEAGGGRPETFADNKPSESLIILRPGGEKPEPILGQGARCRGRQAPTSGDPVESRFHLELAAAATTTVAITLAVEAALGS